MFLTFNVFSQETRKGIIGISLGPSIPLNDFADTNHKNRYAGFAMTGLHLNANFSYKFNKYLGIAALWNRNTHPIDVDKMANYFWSNDPSLNWRVKKASWSSSALMGGLLITFPFKKVDFDLKGLFGYAFSKFPDIDVTASRGRTLFKVRLNEASAQSFAINYGASLRYHVSDKVALTLNMDCFGTNQEFKVVISSNFIPSTRDTIEQFMPMKNISFGIGYRIK